MGLSPWVFALRQSKAFAISQFISKQNGPDQHLMRDLHFNGQQV